MKKYKDRYLRKISRAIGVVYLLTAISWGFSACSFTNQRNELKEDFNSGELTREEYLQECMKFSEKEEDMFFFLTSVFVGNTAVDLAFHFATRNKDL